jgi:hypothetical protein
MQIIYDIRCSISEYCQKVKCGEWVYPSYTMIAHKHGAYYRLVFNEKGKFGKIRIQRYLYKHSGKGTATFSLLVKGVIPYSKYPLCLVTQAMTTWAGSGWSIYKTLDTLFTNLPDASEELLNMGLTQMYRFKKLYEMALIKYAFWNRYARGGYALEMFIRQCCKQGCLNAERLSVAYYEGNGGHEQNSQFLFGTASQFRKACNDVG